MEIYGPEDFDDLDDFNDFLQKFIDQWYSGLPDGSIPNAMPPQEYLESILGPLPEGAVNYAYSDLDGDGKNDLYAVDADGNPHTIYGYNDDEVTSVVYSDYLRDTVYGGTAPQTWDDIVKILKAEGYDDESIEEVRGSIKCLTNANEIDCGENEKFQGSVVLAGILNNSGYDGSWWDVRPTAGQPCQTDDGKQGEYDTNGGCVETEEPADGADCEYAAGIPGKIENGECTFTVGADCVEGSVPGTVDSEGKCDTGGDGTVDCDANPNDPECVDKSFQDYVDEVGEDIANTAKGIYDDFKDVITDCAGNPIECIKKIGDKVAEAGIPEKCQDLEECSVADPDKGTYCWKDCVNFNVLAGIPGLPQLPGMGEIDVGTYRDFEDFLKGIGKDIGDFIEDPAGTLEGWKDAIIQKVKDVFADTTDTKVSDIIDWLKGIFGVYAATWIWGELEEEITNLIPVAPIDEECPEDVSEINADNFEKCGYKDCGGGKYVKVEESCDEVIENFDCSTVGKQGGIVQAGTEKQDENCGECLEGYEEDADGNCIEKEVPPECGGPTAEECTALHKEHLPCTDLEDASCGECLEGYKAEGDNCVKDDEGPDDGTYDPVCTEPRPTGQLTFQLEEQQFAWDQKCRATHCESGVPIEDDPDCYGPPPGETCDNNAVNPDDCNDCGDGTTPDQHIDGDCNKDLKNIDDTGGQCPADSERAGQNPLYDGRDTNKSGFFTSSNGITYTYEPCNPSLGYSTVGQDVNVCEDQNNLNYGNIVQQPEEPCGDCKPGFDKPEGYDTCVSIVDVLCKDDNVSGNYEDCGTAVDCSEITEDNYYKCCSEITEDNYYKCGKVKCPVGSITKYVDNADECKASPADCADPNSEPSEDGGCVCKENFIVDPRTRQCLTSDQFCDKYPDEPECKPEVEQCVTPDGTLTGATLESGCEECPTGQDFNTDGICVDIDITENCENGATNYPDCNQCPKGKILNDQGVCVTTDVASCDEQNRVTNEDGTCGECKAGYTFDTNQDLCVADGGEDECANGATDFPACTTCPEGQSMDAENNCVGVTTPPPETGGGGGGGGGGMMGSFTPFLAGISYTPQAVPEPPAPAQKDYMAELDNIIKRSLFEGMA